MKRRFAAIAVVFLLLSRAAVVLQAAPVFYISTSPVPTTPSLLNLDVATKSSGTFNIFANSDIRLAGVSLDLVETGGAIRFTGATIHNPSTRWAFTGTPVVSNSVVARIDGAAIPGLVGDGIGAGSPEGAEVLFASVNYTAKESGTSQLFLRVGANVIVDWQGNQPNVHFGTDTSGPVKGTDVGNGGLVGSIHIRDPPVITDANVGCVFPGLTATHTFQANQPVTNWQLVSLLGPSGAQPVVAPTFSSTTGTFTWTPQLADIGGQLTATWIATVFGSNEFGSDTGTLTMLVFLCPEPTSASLVALAMMGLVGLVRRRR